MINQPVPIVFGSALLRPESTVTEVSCRNLSPVVISRAMHPDVHERIEIVSSIVYHVLEMFKRLARRFTVARCFRKAGRKTSVSTFRELKGRISLSSR